ncbi:RNA-directed DNA polymerase, eukaryota, reverse transcriptase zinc-binding domain protein [Tanacetum coccineum]
MLYGEKLSMTFMVLMVASIPILPLLEVAVFGVTLSKISHLFNLSTLASIILVNDCNVCDRWCVNDGVWGGTWSWRFPPRGCALDDLEALVSLIGNLSLSDDDDKCSWSRDASGSFKVKTCCNIIQDNALADCRLGLHHSWNSLIPRKVNICIWRASINRLATHANLASRGIDIPSTLCLFYDLEIKSIEHCFISCSHVLPTWRKVWSWWQLDPPTSFPSFSIADIAMGHVGTKMPSEYQQDYKKTLAYAPKIYNDPNMTEQLKNIYRALESSTARRKVSTASTELNIARRLSTAA